MSRSKKDGKRRGAHGVIYGTFLRDGFGAYITGEPRGRREPMVPATKRQTKRATSRARRRKFKQNMAKFIQKELD